MLILQKCPADAGLIKHTYTGSMHRMLHFLTVEIDIKIITDAHVITNSSLSFASVHTVFKLVSPATVKLEFEFLN